MNAIYLIVSFSLAALCSAAAQIDANLLNKNVERTIDLTTQLVKVQHKITLENKVKSDLAGTTYTFVVPSEQRDNLAWISVKDASKKELKTTEEKIAEGFAFTVTLAANSALSIETIFTKLLQPYPQEIPQAERQFVRYFGNAYFYSPYKTLQQKTTVQLTSKAVESYTPVKPSSQADSVITYGPYENVARKAFYSQSFRSIECSTFCLPSF